VTIVADDELLKVIGADMCDSALTGIIGIIIEVNEKKNAKIIEYLFIIYIPQFLFIQSIKLYYK
jgi:hypothetical protein